MIFPLAGNYLYHVPDSPWSLTDLSLSPSALPTRDENYRL